MGGLIRRRGLILPNSSGDEWDYEWDYTMGLLSANGWTKTVNGAASEVLVSDGVRLSSNYGTYIRLSNSDFLTNVGTLEVKFIPFFRQSPANGQNNRIALSNGTNGITVFPMGNSWWVMTSTGNPNTNTELSNIPATSGTEYTVRLIMDNNNVSAYINGELAYEGLASNSEYSSLNAVWSQNQKSNQGNYYGLFKSIKFKRSV